MRCNASTIPNHTIPNLIYILTHGDYLNILRVYILSLLSTEGIYTARGREEIMTREDVDKLSRLIGGIYRSVRPFSAEDNLAWYYVLGEYDYKTAKSAALDLIREGDLQRPPNAADIAARLAPLRTKKKTEQTEFDVCPEDVINNFRAYAAIIEEPFPAEIRTPQEAYAWFKQKKAERRAQCR